MNRVRIRFVSRGCVLAGLVLVLVNLVGFFLYTTIEEDNPHVRIRPPRRIGEREFWENAYRRSDEDVGAYVNRLMMLVSHRMLKIEPRYVKPTFFENYILWAGSRLVGYYEWTNTRRAIRLGGGFCSQNAIVFNNILREQGIESRILHLHGHVINEVLIDGQWQVFDADHGVAFGRSLKELEAAPRQVYEAYREFGHSELQARRCEEIFGSADDNLTFETSAGYSPAKTFVENAALWLVWLFPAGLIATGMTVSRIHKLRR